MTYPKPFMSLEELSKFSGLSKDYLKEVYRRKDNDFAGKLNPAAPNSKIMFDTEKFDEWRTRQIRMEVNAINRRGVVA